MAIHIQEVPFGSDFYKALLTVRDEVLRKPIGMQLREKDIALDDKEFHIAAFDNDEAIGCVLLRPIDAQIIQLRQMAVTEPYKGKGIGAKLVAFAEEIARKKNYKIMETKARKTAQGFYEKLGYAVSGGKFAEISIHLIWMRKLLTPVE